MRFYPVSSRLAGSLVALAVSTALLFSTCAFAFASPSRLRNATQSKPAVLELQLTSATANASAAGVTINWTTNATLDNLGFNIYRVSNRQRTRINREIIPGALMASLRPDMVRGGYSYAWFDPRGTADDTYVIESVNVSGSSRVHSSIRPLLSKSSPEQERQEFNSTASTPDNPNAFEKYYPATDSQQPNIASGAIENQWTVAGQSALKIAIKKDGWYRVTHTQMIAAGWNPTVDIRNLRLFEDGNEVAISTSQFFGLFGSGDYIEFYGRGLAAPTTDTRTYYLIGGTTPGKRVASEFQLNGPADPEPAATPNPAVTPPVSQPTVPANDGPVLRDPVFFSWALRDLNVWADSIKPAAVPVANETKRKVEKDNARSAATETFQPENYRPETSPAKPIDPVEERTAQPTRADEKARQNAILFAKAAGSAIGKSLTAATPLAASPAKAKVSGKAVSSKKKKGSTARRKSRPVRHHALLVEAPPNFDSTIEIRERVIHIANILNGDEENWFGRVIPPTGVNLPLSVSNLDTTATQPVTIEFALQGIMSQFAASHQVNVTLNGNAVTTVDFSAIEHPVRTVSVPLAQLQNGANTLTFAKTTTASCVVDYVRLTYPHTYKADAGSLRFNLRGTQTVSVDGFATPDIRLIDYTDPLAVSLISPSAQASAGGYAITVPVSEPRSKDQRLFLAIPESQFEQPAALSLNQPSSLNSSANDADFVVISHKNFIANLSALQAQRTSQGFKVLVADVEDVYDEFGYGKHGPKAIRDFLQHAAGHWVTPPRYVIFAGDSSLDPRNYMALPNGGVDFVPTKLVDATFNETCSDDWFTDFDNDGIANIPVGRLPLRTTSDASLILSKIVNFAPVLPESAMLVADDPTGYYFNFEAANDDVQALLPGSMTVQRVNVRTQPSPAQAKANVIAGFNSGRDLVNYTGHGNVDVWAGSSIFHSNDALALTNGSNLSFVVVMDCLNGYFHDPVLLSLSEALLKAPNGGAVAGFASSGLTFPDGQHEMSQRLYTLIYGGPAIALGDAIKDAKSHTNDIDVRRTWIYFGDPSLKIR